MRRWDLIFTAVRISFVFLQQLLSSFSVKYCKRSDLCMWRTWTRRRWAPLFLGRLTPGGHLENKEKKTEWETSGEAIWNSEHGHQVQQDCFTCSFHRNHTKPQAAQKNSFANRRDDRVQGDFYKAPPSNHFNQASQPGTSSTWWKRKKKRTQNRQSFDLYFRFFYTVHKLILHCIHKEGNADVDSVILAPESKE